MRNQGQVLTEADGTALANLCVDVSILIQAQESLTKTGLLSKSGRSGMIHQSPLLNVVAMTTGRVTRALREFGLTPASRSRIQMIDESGDDDLMTLLLQPREPLLPEAALQRTQYSCIPKSDQTPRE
jgi:P27 family predicted phage terminase small subunit